MSTLYIGHIQQSIDSMEILYPVKLTIIFLSSPTIKWSVLVYQPKYTCRDPPNISRSKYFTLKDGKALIRM
jgi:hypothetical protein